MSILLQPPVDDPFKVSSLKRLHLPVFNLLSNPGFEVGGAGGIDIWEGWTEVVGDGTLTNEGVIVHKGSKAAKLTAGTGRNTHIWGAFTVIAGKEYRLRLWTAGDGTYTGRYALYDVSNAGDIASRSTTGIISTTYTEVVKEFTGPIDCTLARLYLYCPNTNTKATYFDTCSIYLLD